MREPISSSEPEVAVFSAFVIQDIGRWVIILFLFLDHSAVG
jgi:hypothetical protein